MTKRSDRSKAARRPQGAIGLAPTAAGDLWRRAQRQTAAGDHAAAADLFRRCLDLEPGHVEAWSGLGQALKSQGDMPRAIEAYRSAVRLKPDFQSALLALAELVRRQGDAATALDLCERALAQNADSGDGRFVRALIRKDLKLAEGAAADLRFVVGTKPPSAGVLTLIATLFEDLDCRADAATALRAALTLAPDDDALRRRLAALYGRDERWDEAIPVWRAIVHGDAARADDHRHLALACRNAGRQSETFDAFQAAIAAHPNAAQTFLDFGSFLVDIGEFALAAGTFGIITQLRPDHVLGHYNLGLAKRFLGDLDGAEVCLERALACDPDHVLTLLELTHVRQHFCTWDGLDAMQARFRALSYERGHPVTPFSVITSVASPAAHRACATLWATTLERPASDWLASYRPRPPEARGTRLRIGYVSADFLNHATAILVADVLEHHDRERFHVFGYSYGPDDGSAMRRRIVQAFETFVDIRDMTDAQAARRIHADGIDILIDLKGYTQGARTAILAYRPAPIQVNYLAYPSTMGAPFIDYILADDIVTPPGHDAFYTEAIVRLPNCYQPNDRKRAIDADVPSRAACGLPDDGFVFCCFNNTYKITPAIFDIWMRLLRQTDGSVLWLLGANGRVETNLRREAERRGVDGARLVFAGRLPVPSHLARFAKADLFLDTLPVNAHTTASEALWAGLPVLTCLGDAFVARVAGSILAAVGLPELVATSLDAYESTALRLATDREELAGLRSRLEANRLRCPLFDTPRYVDAYERALVGMNASRDANLPPRPFHVADRRDEAAAALR